MPDLATDIATNDPDHAGIHNDERTEINALRTRAQSLEDDGTAAQALSAAASAQTTADGAVPQSAYNANSILISTLDNDPQPLTVAASTLIGRAAAGGISALSVSDVRTLLGLTDEHIQDIVGAMVVGGTETGITVTYDDTNGRFDFVVSGGGGGGGGIKAFSEVKITSGNITVSSTSVNNELTGFRQNITAAEGDLIEVSLGMYLGATNVLAFDIGIRNGADALIRRVANHAYGYTGWLCGGTDDTRADDPQGTFRFLAQSGDIVSDQLRLSLHSWVTGGSRIISADSNFPAWMQVVNLGPIAS